MDIIYTAAVSYIMIVFITSVKTWAKKSLKNINNKTE